MSLLLASAKIADHVADGDLTGPVRVAAARRVADRWADGRARGRGGAGARRRRAARRRRRAATRRAPTTILDVTAPTEAATSAAFAHTADRRRPPGQRRALAEAGRLFGRLAHLLDAVEDLHADRAAGAWNPIVALGLRPAEVRALCDDAVLGIRLALREVELVDGRLVHTLLVHELATAVERTFTTAGQPARAHRLRPGEPPHGAPPDPSPPPVGWEAPPSVDAPARSGVLRACGGWCCLRDVPGVLRRRMDQPVHRTAARRLVPGR